MRSRAPLLIILAIGVALAAAPMAFQMFTRAPMGGQMIAEFKPFMRPARLNAFEGHLTTIGSAVESLHRRNIGLDHPLVAELDRQWPTIDRDMTGMLDTIRDNLDNYAAVAALPPFPLFPWFFLVPGLLLAWAAGAALRGAGSGSGGGSGGGGGGGLTGGLRVLLVALGLGLVAAPVMFQMFSRAPLGGHMIADFRPLMTEARIEAVQRYFLVIGAAEGALRTEVLPDLDSREPQVRPVEEFIAAWPDMAADMAPMIGAMSDNLDNFAAVAAMPPFGMFPWFFLVPGLLVAGLALVADGDENEDDDDDHEHEHDKETVR